MHSQDGLIFMRLTEASDWRAFAEEMHTVDRALFGEIGAQDLGQPSYWVAHFDRCPEQIVMCRHAPSGALVGYFQFIPVTADFATCILRGSVRDGEIPLDAVVPYGTGGRFHLYVTTLAILPLWRGRGVSQRLFEMETEFQRCRPALMQSLISVGWSPCGERFFLRLGLPKVGVDAHGRSIYQRLGGMPTITPPRPLPAAA